MDPNIIDFHNHAFPEKIEEKAIEHLERHYKVKIPRRGSFEALVDSAKRAGISTLVLHASATHKSQVVGTNDWIAALAKEDIIGFGTIHPNFKNFKEELKRIKGIGLKGLKLHPDFQGFNVDDPKMYPIYEALEPGFPVLIHVGDESLEYSSPRRLSKVLDIFPHLTIIGAHLGGYSRWEEAKEYLVGRDLYLDTSSSLWKLDAQEATNIIRSHGIEKILFGSDYPVGSHSGEIQRLLELSLTNEEQNKILWENAARLLKLG